MIARRKRGIGLPQVQEDLDRLGHVLAAEYPATNAGIGIAAVSLHDSVTGQARTPLLLLVGAAAAVLLISCANVAHLLLARTVSRGGELTLRAALGATRGRLLRQSLTESALLALGGGALGGLAAVAVVEALVRACLQPCRVATSRRGCRRTRLRAAVLGGCLCSGGDSAGSPCLARQSGRDAQGARQTSTPHPTLLGPRRRRRADCAVARPARRHDAPAAKPPQRAHG